MEGTPEYAEAKDLFQQAQRVLESAFEDMLLKVQLMGRTAFKDALKLDPSLGPRLRLRRPCSRQEPAVIKRSGPAGGRTRAV